MVAVGNVPPTQEPVEAAPAAALPAEGQAPDGPDPGKRKRGKPKDTYAPPKPKNAYQRVSREARVRLKEQMPELATDFKAMGEAVKVEWDKVSDEEKARMTEEYEKEMEIWRPKWAAYKQTKHYKEFFERKQDWVDARAIKRMKKKASKEAPTRPKSGYMIFASEIRERVGEELKAAGGGISDIAKKISEEWAALSEAKKAGYAERSAKMKEKWLVEYREYKKSNAFKKFLCDQARLISKQKQKKLARLNLSEAPRRPPSAKGLFLSKTTEQVMAEHKGKKIGELTKIYSELWDKASPDEKAKYMADAAILKKE